MADFTNSDHATHDGIIDCILNGDDEFSTTWP